MLSKINNASIALVVSDDDVHLFFECVFEEEFDLSMFMDSQMQTVLERQGDFDYIMLDMQVAQKERACGRWKLICQIFERRIFLLVGDSEMSVYYKKFARDARCIPYPFTKKTFYLFFKSGVKGFRGDNDCNEIKTKKIDDASVFEKVPQFSRLVGSCEKLNEIKRKLLMVADTDTPLIFFGESGTGKTMAAQIAHELSLRKDKPFVIANMANSNRDLIESVLFGSVRGAFTDARERKGLFRAADGGTLFMDEIADLSLECQSKLLRVIESGIFRPLGSDEEYKSDVRLIFATNADLRSLVRKKLFREDLYWRIVDFPIVVPALRDRCEDIPLLIESELKEIQKKSERSYSITKAAVNKMQFCDWPGNFRQFKACLRRAAILSRYTGVIDEDAISF